MYVSNFTNNIKSYHPHFQGLAHRCIETETYNEYIAPIEKSLKKLAEDCDIEIVQQFDSIEFRDLEYDNNRPEQGFKITVSKPQPTAYENIYGMPEKSIFVKKQDDILGKVSKCKDEVKVYPFDRSYSPIWP